VLSVRAVSATLVLAVFLLTAACGYHVGGKADMVPKTVETIAVLPFLNGSNRYKLSDKMQQAISRELVSRTRFRVVRDPDAADAVLQGSLGNVMVYPVVFDPATYKTTVVQISVLVQAKLTDRKTGKVLYNRPLSGIQNSYEVSLYANQYFDESELALERVSTDLARTVVSGILENF
jgi:hypothetical protein